MSQVPWPRALFARRRGGSSGSRCGTPFFPRVLEGLVGLQNLVVPGQPVSIPERQVLQSVPEVEQLRAVAVQFAGQLGGGDALGEPADDQDQFAGPTLGAAQARAGERIEDSLAVTAPKVQDRGAAAAVDDHAVVSPALRAGHPLGVQPFDHGGVAGVLIHQVNDREIHGRLQTGTTRRVSPSIAPPGRDCKSASHQLAYMSPHAAIMRHPEPMKMGLGWLILDLGPFTWTEAGFSLVLRART